MFPKRALCAHVWHRLGMDGPAYAKGQVILKRAVVHGQREATLVSAQTRAGEDANVRSPAPTSMAQPSRMKCWSPF